jgi:predicted ester cyclase
MDNKTFVQKWYDEVWNKKNEEAIYEMFSAKGVAHGLLDEDGNEIVGPEKFSQFFKKFINSFPDIFVSVDDTFNEGEKTASRCTVSFTHSGEAFQLSREKAIAPTNKKTEFTGIAITIIRDGQIQEAWNNFDFLTMYMQLGLL